MKKSLIALAALAATGAFAQSSVTISGNMDFAGASVTGTQLVGKGSTVSTTVGTSSTSVLRFIAVEDLGGGMKATAQYNFDPRTLSNDSLGVTNNNSTSVTAATAAVTGGAAATPGSALAQGNTVTGLARDEVFVGLSGGFGNLRLGAPNSIGLGVHGVSSPLGTGIGSGYAPTTGTVTNAYVQTRYSRSARYDSPTIGGFTASVQYAPGNDQTLTSSTGTATAQSVPVALVIPNARQATEFGLSYAAGPLNVAFANIGQAKSDNKVGFYSGAAAVLVKTSANVLAANYSLGSTTVYALVNKGDALASTTAVVATKGSRVAVKQTMGAIDLMAQYTQQETNGVKAKVTGLRADYNLSKTAAVYAGYEKWDTGAAYSSNTTTGDRKIASVGLRKSF